MQSITDMAGAVKWFESLSSAQKREALLQFAHLTPTYTLSNLHEEIGGLLKVDFVKRLPEEITLKVLSHLSAKELCAVETVCRCWNNYCKKHSEDLWKPLYRDQGWDPQFHAFRPNNDKDFYAYKSEIESNWLHGKYLTRRFRGHTKAVFCLQMVDSVLYSGSFDHTIKVWNLASGECLKTIQAHDNGVSCLRYESGVLVTGSSDNTLKVWTRDLNSCLHTLKGHAAEVTCLYHDGKTIVSGSCDNTLRKWNLKTGEMIATLRGHEDYVINLMFDESVIISGSFDRSIKIWDFDTGECKRTLTGHGGGIRGIKFDRKYIVSGSVDRTVRVWDMSSYECVAVLRGHTGEVWSVQMLYTGLGGNSKLNRIISGGRDGVRVWEVDDDNKDFKQSHMHIPTDKGHSNSGIISIDLDPCTIACSSFDKSIALYEFDKKWRQTRVILERRNSLEEIQMNE